AAAIRFVEVTSEACALVCARAGKIEWVAKSGAFHYRIPWRGDALPAESHALSASSGGPNALDAEAVPPDVWLEFEQRHELEVCESAIAIPSQDQVLSLLWVIEADEHE
ncbi:MAG: hypothetical protein LC667_08875, partial [Thioalkalivibrio sp.]|nr:hypothetical protein [Thioalkalivibrio sp.]